MFSGWESRIAFVKFDPVFPRLLKVVFLCSPCSLDAVRFDLPLMVNVLCSLLIFSCFWLDIFTVSIFTLLFLACMPSSTFCTIFSASNVSSLFFTRRELRAWGVGSLDLWVTMNTNKLYFTFFVAKVTGYLIATSQVQGKVKIWANINMRSSCESW